MCIDEGVNKLYVGRKVVIVIEFTHPRERERGKEQDPKLGFVLEHLLQHSSTSMHDTVDTAGLLNRMMQQQHAWRQNP